jgi:hypothetical protein
MMTTAEQIRKLRDVLHRTSCRGCRGNIHAKIAELQRDSNRSAAA